MFLRDRLHQHLGCTTCVRLPKNRSPSSIIDGGFLPGRVNPRMQREPFHQRFDTSSSSSTRTPVVGKHSRRIPPHSHARLLRRVFCKVPGYLFKAGERQGCAYTGEELSAATLPPSDRCPEPGSPTISRSDCFVHRDKQATMAILPAKLRIGLWSLR